MPLFKQGRAPLLHTLRNAFIIAKKSKNAGSPPADELIDIHTKGLLHRRRFIGDVVKTGVALSAAGYLNACRKVSDLAAPPTPTLHERTTLKSTSARIAIVGAGIAGLNCAYQLQKMGYTAAVYEGATRSGGRMFTAKDILAPGLVTELGGEFIDSEHKDMLQLCHEFGLPLLDTLSKEELSYARDSFYIDGRFYSEAEVIAAFLPYANRIDRDIKSLPNVMTYDQHNTTTLQFDFMSITAYLDSIGMTGFIRKGIETAYLTEYGLETNLQSAINFLYLFSANTANGFYIFGTSDERYKIAGGNQQLTTALYEKVKQQVSLDHKLTELKETVGGYRLYFAKGNSTVAVDADLVVMTVPFSVLKDVKLNVALPDWKKNAIQNLGYGTNSKLLIGFNSRVWRHYGYSGYAFTNQQIQSGWDNSALQGGTRGGFTVYQGGNKGVALGTGTPESQAGTFVKQLEQMWPGAKDAFNGTVKRMHWPAYPFTKGSYACYKVGQYTSIRGAEIKPVGNLYFAGEHCSSYFQGFMNGAAETGRMAASAILKVLKPNAALVLN